MTRSQAALRGTFFIVMAVVLVSASAVTALAKPSRRTPAATLRLTATQTRHDTAAARRPQHRAKSVSHARTIARTAFRSQKAQPVRLLPLVVVDAGHGGGDPGAIGPSGTLEKTVALATAQELGRQLRATRRYRVLFTRDDDTFVSLPARVRLAITNGAALMISIHADASVDQRARGASVYIRPAQSSGPDVTHLPAHSGSRAIARALAEPAPPTLESARLQLAMVASLDDDLSMVPDPARLGRFHVLGAVGIPSVLVETGFISNLRDEALLRQPRHRAMIARAIRDAVEDYFAMQRPSAVPAPD
jgi:N-acetylmuramoyl-L-alanine amidase